MVEQSLLVGRGLTKLYGGVTALAGATLAAEPHGIVGAIVGRALYDGRVTVPDAIRVLKGE